jgi:hypothetical protein
VFAQVIIAEDVAEDATTILDRWLVDVRPGAIGWLGSTAGLTPDGRLVVVARFTSPEDAHRNSARPEQDAWWNEAEKRLGGTVTFHDCSDVALILDGGRDVAGYVQVIESRPNEPMTAAEVAEMTSRWVREYRPDVLGGLVAVAADGTVFEVVYFTSEEEARVHEAQELPEAVRGEVDAFQARFAPPRYHDLPDPMLSS